MYAGDDRLLNPKGSRNFAAAAPKGVVTSVCFDPLYHEIFMSWTQHRSSPSCDAGWTRASEDPAKRGRFGERRNCSMSMNEIDLLPSLNINCLLSILIFLAFQTPE